MRTCLHTCPRTLSLRSKLVARFLSLPVSLRTVLNALRGNLFAPNLSTILVIAKLEKIFFAKPKCEPATSHTCGVVEAISLQATLVFGLLRYARNDKSQDRHEAQRLSR